MPKGATSRGARASRNQRTATATNTDTVTVIESEKKETETPMTTTATATEDTVRELPFTLQVTPAPDDYKPDRSPAGRKRIPSPFEGLLPELKGKGWQNQPHDGKVTVEENGKVILPDGVKDSNARVILRELAKAVKFLNTDDGGEHNLGLDVNVTATDVQFNIRDKQVRRARTLEGDESTDGETADDPDEDSI